MLNIADKSNARPQPYGDFMFLIGDAPEFNTVLIFVTGASAECQFEFPPEFPTRYFRLHLTAALFSNSCSRCASNSASTEAFAIVTMNWVKGDFAAGEGPALAPV
jgi:hypothetical protein